jgi:hypothetical protein
MSFFFEKDGERKQIRCDIGYMKLSIDNMWREAAEPDEIMQLILSEPDAIAQSEAFGYLVSKLEGGLSDIHYSEKFVDILAQRIGLFSPPSSSPPPLTISATRSSSSSFSESKTESVLSTTTEPDGDGTDEVGSILSGLSFEPPEWANLPKDRPTEQIQRPDTSTLP